MDIISEGINNDYINDKYGKFGPVDSDGMPTVSLPIIIKNAHENTKSFALIMDDPDSLPVAGFVWLHWLAANIHTTVIPENASETSLFIQGKNSWGCDCYGGPAPPNATHRYVLTVYALDTDLPVETGFSLKELNSLINGHILDKAVITGLYRHK